MTGRARASVVIPAYNEATVIGRCLAALAAEPVAAELEVVVVANGCSDETVAEANKMVSRLPGLVVVDLPQAGKIGALNAGDDAVTAEPRIYLDADIVLGAGALPALLTALETGDPVVASPKVVFDTTRSTWPVRAFFRTFEQLPYVTDGLVGLGVYGLSGTGRARFQRFPSVTADDLFVQQMFARDERITTPGTFVHTAPRRLRALLAVRVRGAQGKRELDEVLETPHPLPSSAGRALIRLVRHDPRMAPAALVYVVVAVVSRWRARRVGSGWLRDETTREPDVARVGSEDQQAAGG